MDVRTDNRDTTCTPYNENGGGIKTRAKKNETSWPRWPCIAHLIGIPDMFESIGLSVQEKKFKIDFQDRGHLGFPIRIIIATFDLQVTSILQMKFPVNCHYGSVLRKSSK